VNEIISNNSQLYKHEFNSENKIKNNFVHENKVLKNILEGSNAGKNKENLNNNLNTFMTQFNALNGNEVTNKINEPVVHRDTITSDLLKSVKYMEAQNIKELTVKVAPKELGELTIKLTVENGIMKANITANNESTLHLINSHLPEINQKLVEQNMQIQSFSVGISNNDMSYFNQNSQGNSGQQQNHQKTVYNHNSQEKDLGFEDITLNTNNVDVLA
jgi:flagellar hook-length control protein FliK